MSWVSAMPALVEAQALVAGAPAVRLILNPRQPTLSVTQQGSAGMVSSCPLLQRRQIRLLQVQGVCRFLPPTTPPQQPFAPYDRLRIAEVASVRTRQAAVASCARRALAASSTETAVSRDIEGKSSRKSSSVEAPSRQSKRFFTGTLVPLKQSAP